MAAADNTDPKPQTARKHFYKEVGLLIRQARRNADNMSQEALASSVGLSRTSLTNIEKGRQNLLLHTFTKIAAALHVPTTALLPSTENVLQGLGVTLPTSLAPEERGFIERAIGTGGPNEIEQAKRNRIESKSSVTKKQNIQSPNRR